MRLFRLFLRPKPVVTEAMKKEIKSTFVEIKQLSESDSYEDLSRAMGLINDIDMKYASICRNAAKIYRGRVGVKLIETPEFQERTKTL